MNRSGYGMLLDRGLTLEQLELAFHVATVDPDPKTNRRRLTIELRDLVGDQEAQGKTKKCLTRVWLKPPAEAAAMIQFAVAASWPAPIRPMLQFGAVLATFPFAGVVARVLGQHFQMEGEAEARDVRAEVRRALGDRSSVDVAARKAYTTFRNLGIVTQAGQTLRPSTDGVDVPATLGSWLGHAVLLTRQAEMIRTTTLRNAPELLGLRLPAALSPVYPLLETHSHIDTPVLAERAVV